MTVNLVSPLKLPDKPRPGEYTLYLDPNDFRQRLWAAISGEDVGAGNSPSPNIQEAKSFDFQHKILFDGQKEEKAVAARAHAVLCFAKKAFSVTVRAGGKVKAPEPRLKVPGDGLVLPFLPEFPEKERFTSFDVLYTELGKVLEEQKGLVLVTGGTGSGKTSHVNAVLHLYLRKLVLRNKKGRELARVPHVVAMGDPVESLFFCTGKNSVLEECRARQIEFEERPLDFTPRIIGHDVPSVKEGLDDAKRETPEVVIVSELRNESDFAAALEFAESGHLIVATAHSNSLVETFGRLLKIMGPSDAGTRAALVQRLVAVVHLQRIGGYRVPALWRSNPRGRQDFISEGLSSIIAHNPVCGESAEHGILGHYFMLKNMNDMQIKKRSRRLINYNENLKAALQLDLNGR